MTDPRNLPLHCGLCGDAKHPHRYDAADANYGLQAAPAKPRTVYLCDRCDLTPDPPYRP